MGKLRDRLDKQLLTEYKQDAIDCIKIYDKLKEMTGGVWSSNWSPLTDVVFKGFPSDQRRYLPSSVGRVFLDGLK